MKTRLLILSISLFVCLGSLSGQIDKGNKKANLESQKIAFITRKLNLSVNEAQKFWPVYNEFQQKREDLFKRRREILKRINNKESQPGDDELLKLSDEFIQLQMNESKLASEYHTKFKEVLHIRKVMEYYKAEEQFKVWLLGEVKRNPRNPEIEKK